nr:unnamed protein product [Callosobruchus chinensis]
MFKLDENNPTHHFVMYNNIILLKNPDEHINIKIAEIGCVCNSFKIPLDVVLTCLKDLCMTTSCTIVQPGEQLIMRCCMRLNLQLPRSKRFLGTKRGLEMPRKTVCPPPGTRRYGVRSNYTEGTLKEALEKIKSGELSTYAAYQIYGIPRSTLRNKLKEKHVMVKLSEGRQH